MPEPQPILATLTEHALFLVLTIDDGGEEASHDLLEDLPGLVRTVGFRAADGRLSAVVAIGSDAWDRLFSGPRPSELHEFRRLDEGLHHAPSTPGDILLHVRARTADLCFELARLVMDRLRGHATVIDETAGFRYFDQRDLLGFVDGTENPTGATIAPTALVTGDPPFDDGSYVTIQKYLHDLTAWNGLTTEQQEHAVGRTKLDNVELDDHVKPTNAHVALNVIEDDDGNELKILRDNMPFGRVGSAEFGTYFIGYAATPRIIEQMLTNMFHGRPPGNYDRLLDFSTAVTGTSFFAPSVDFLDDLPDLPDTRGATS